MRHCQKCGNNLSTKETYRNIQDNEGAIYQIWICDDCEESHNYEEHGEADYYQGSDCDNGL